MTETWSTWAYLVDGPWGLLAVAAFAFWLAFERTMRRKDDER